MKVIITIAMLTPQVTSSTSQKRRGR